MRLSLEYKSQLADDPTAPLFFFVHGRAGNREVMWTFRRGLPEGISVIAPEAPRPDPIGGFSWWDVNGEITDEMIDEGVLKLSNFIDEAIEKLNLRPRKIVALGFSQGSGALSVVVQRRPTLFHGLGILAGFLIKDTKNADTLYDSLPQVFIAHGTQDQVVPIERARNGAEWFKERGAAVTLVEDDVTHKVGTTGMRELRFWISALLAH